MTKLELEEIVDHYRISISHYLQIKNDDLSEGDKIWFYSILAMDEGFPMCDENRLKLLGMIEESESVVH